MAKDVGRTEKALSQLQAGLDQQYAAARDWLKRDPINHKRFLTGVAVLAQVPENEFRDLIGKTADGEAELIQRVLEIGVDELAAKVWADDGAEAQAADGS